MSHALRAAALFFAIIVAMSSAVYGVMWGINTFGALRFYIAFWSVITLVVIALFSWMLTED